MQYRWSWMLQIEHFKESISEAMVARQPSQRGCGVAFTFTLIFLAIGFLGFLLTGMLHGLLLSLTLMSDRTSKFNHEAASSLFGG